MPDSKATLAAIIERKRVLVGVALRNLTEASQAGDHQSVARMVEVINKADSELAKLYGLGSETINVQVQTSAASVIAEARERLRALSASNVIDAEVIES